MHVSVCALLLLSLLSLLPVRVYVNLSSSRHRVTRFRGPLQTIDAIVVLHPLVKDEWSLSPNGRKLPQVLQLVQPRAAFVAVNFQQLKLLPGDKVLVHDPNSSMSVTVTSANATSLVQELASSTKSPHSLLLRTHPFLVQGDTIVVEYFPSIPTLMLPNVSNQHENPAVILDSYAYVTTVSGTSLVGIDTESTVGAKDEAKEAVCYRKTQPKMYGKARAVARLMIRTTQEQVLRGSEQATSWTFCTGWLIGRSNHLITNHHCMKDAAVVECTVQDSTEEEAASTELQSNTMSHYWPYTSPLDKTGRIVEAVVGFMAEAKSCRETGFIRQNVGMVEATRVAVIAENPELDYALLQVLPNNSATNLTKRYGSLRLRAAGPVDGEAIYIPQHPRGEPKEIAAMKDGKPAVIEVFTSNSLDSLEFLRRHSEPSDLQPTVWYNADTEPGSSGSPVLSRKDNTVVALHRAGTSESTQSASTELYNMGVRIDLIARDLQRRNVLPRNALAS